MTERNNGNVLVATSVFPRWAGDATPPFVQNQCELMVQAGWQVAVLAPHSVGAKFSETVNGVHIRRYPYALPLRLQKLCYEGGMLVQMKARPWTKCLLPFLFLGQQLVLFYTCLRNKPDVLHSHSLLPQGLSAGWVAQILGIPHVTTSHGNDVFGLKDSGLMGSLKRSVLRDADAITVNSSATEEAVVALGGSPSKIHLIPAVANEAAVDQSVVSDIQVKYGVGKKLLFVGRLIEEKGVLDLMHAFAVIHKEMPEVQCFFVGDGVLEKRLKELAKELSMESVLHFVGWRPREEIPSWMAAVDALVVPSKELDGWKEAQGLVVVEAMAVGTVVVASGVGGIPDMITDGETGYLYESGNGDALITALRKTLSDDDCQQMVKNQLELYRSKYCGDSITKALSRIYSECISSEL